MKAPTERFTGRAEDYARYRPSYPSEVLDLLTVRCGLGAATRVADIGAGTGIFSRLLLDRGAMVVAVEPNAEMRAAAARLLGDRPGYSSVDGTAEASSLEPQSVDLAVAAQSFHWFDPVRTRAELQRILKPRGCFAVVWNERKVTDTPFLQAYENLLLDLAPEYAVVDHRRVRDSDIAAFFAPGCCTVHRFPNLQHLDLRGLTGRLLSSSYAPPEGHPNHLPMLERLQRIFSEHQERGRVTIVYETRVHIGPLG